MMIKRIDGSRSSISCTIFFFNFNFMITPKQLKILVKIGTHKKVSYLFNFVFTSKI